jgi:hypothetical protein
MWNLGGMGLRKMHESHSPLSIKSSRGNLKIPRFCAIGGWYFKTSENCSRPHSLNVHCPNSSVAVYFTHIQDDPNIRWPIF